MTFGKIAESESLVWPQSEPTHNLCILIYLVLGILHGTLSYSDQCLRAHCQILDGTCCSESRGGCWPIGPPHITYTLTWWIGNSMAVFEYRCNCRLAKRSNKQFFEVFVVFTIFFAEIKDLILQPV